MWGEQCLSRFNGIFSLAIYDRGTGIAPATLFLARDRAGKKPLYYTVGAHSFQFASELKALQSRSGIDAHATNFYLALGYIPGELSLCENVRKLPAGHAARIDVATLKMHTWRYWELPENRPPTTADGEALADEARHADRRGAVAAELGCADRHPVKRGTGLKSRRRRRRA